MSDAVLRRTLDDWRRSGPSVIDDPHVPTRPQVPKRRRGRPKGSKGATVTAGKQLSAFDFSFLRATVEGIDPRVAANLYFPELKGPDLAEYHSDLIRRLKLTVLSSPANRDEMERLLNIALLEQPVEEPHLHAATSPAPARPSLDEFMQQMRKIKKQGFYLSQGEIDPMVCGLSVPIRFSTKEAPIALTLVASKNRFDFLNIQKLIEILQNNAAQIEHKFATLSENQSN